MSSGKEQRINAERQSANAGPSPKPLNGTFVNLSGITVYDGPANEARDDYSVGDPVRAKRVKRSCIKSRKLSALAGALF